MKKILLTALLILTLCCFIACGNSEESKKESIPSSEESTVESVEESQSQTVYHTVTFVQEGYEDVVVKVETGKGILEADVPTPNPVVGHTVEWDVDDFSVITSDVTVTAVVVPNEYLITYQLDLQNATVTNATTSVVYGESYELETPTCDGYVFKGWKIKDTDESFASGDAYLVNGDLTLVAVWEVDVASDNGLSGRY